MGGRRCVEKQRRVFVAPSLSLSRVFDDRHVFEIPSSMLVYIHIAVYKPRPSLPPSPSCLTLFTPALCPPHTIHSYIYRKNFSLSSFHSMSPPLPPPQSPHLSIQPSLITNHQKTPTKTIIPEKRTVRLLTTTISHTYIPNTKTK